MNPLDVDVVACRGRQQRLRQVMHQANLDLVIVTQPEHVQWLAGPRFSPLLQSAAALSVDGKLFLIAPQKQPELAAADELLTFEAKLHSTLRNDQRQACQHVLAQALQTLPAPRRVGVEFSSYGRHPVLHEPVELVDVEPDLLRLRRRKDPDELARLRRAIAGTQQMYLRAREIVEPGVEEMVVYHQLQAVAAEVFGELPTATGNDYQCGARGGPPRVGRRAERGELYILDLGPAYRGYFADNARTLAVGAPSQLQRDAWTHVIGVLQMVQATVRPGVSARQLFHSAQQLLDQAPCGVFNHHLGHGIGLFPHEAPHLNPRWDDTFQVGDVFAAEPGLYADSLRHGMRIENDYLVTEAGVECLSDFPLELD